MAEAKKWNDVNHVVMGGRLTADAEIKAGETKDGRKYRLLKFSFATNNAGETMFPSVTLSVPESYKATALVKGAVVTVQGRITIKAGETSPYSLYNESIASFTTGDLYDHHDAEGFINLFGLASKVRGMKHQELNK